MSTDLENGKAWTANRLRDLVNKLKVALDAFVWDDPDSHDLDALVLRLWSGKESREIWMPRASLCCVTQSRTLQLRLASQIEQALVSILHA